MNTPRPPHDTRPIAPIAATDLNRLIETLMVQVVWLSECLVGEGYRLDMGGIGAPGIHYNLAGAGQLIVGDDAPNRVVASLPEL
jgi:AraC family transcriptional activator of mtrCDE